ncbi:hypothetical protein HOY80DRAFT_1049034 [Tuber brumale]|nr:hypothetical protein HOY80DRAFT_1049034 [Tuber brumale]
MIATGTKCNPDNERDLNPVTPSTFAKHKFGVGSLTDEAGHITSRLLCHLDKDISFIKEKLDQLETRQSGTNSDIATSRTKIGAVGETVDVLKAYMETFCKLEHVLYMDTPGIPRMEAQRPKAFFVDKWYCLVYFYPVLSAIFVITLFL